MVDLAPCPACRRHVRVDEAACPFCAAAIAAEPRGLPVGRFARAAVFAGAVAGAAACGGKSKPPDSTNDNIENEASATVDAGVPDATPEVHYRNPPPDDTCCMPYGAPPMRARVV